MLDVGANSGQFAASLRDAGYQGRIVSFEPLSGAFADLERAAASDPLWSCINLALGEENCTAVINVSANSYSSSLLGVCDWSLSVEPSISAVGREEVRSYGGEGLAGLATRVSRGRCRSCIRSRPMCRGCSSTPIP